MRTSDAFWEVFIVTGHVGAYLLYKHYSVGDTESELAAAEFLGNGMAVQE